MELAVACLALFLDPLPETAVPRNLVRPGGSEAHMRHYPVDAELLIGKVSVSVEHSLESTVE